MSKKRWPTKVVVCGSVIEVTPGDEVNSKTLGEWIAQNVELPAIGDLLQVRVTDWYVRRWEEPEEPYVHPAPEVPCRLAEEHEVPRGAKSVRKVALDRDWMVTATYARGTKWNSTEVVDSLALRMGRGERRAVAVWVNGRYAFGARWGDVPTQTVGAKELTACL